MRRKGKKAGEGKSSARSGRETKPLSNSLYRFRVAKGPSANQSVKLYRGRPVRTLAANSHRREMQDAIAAHSDYDGAPMISDNDRAAVNILFRGKPVEDCEGQAKYTVDNLQGFGFTDDRQVVLLRVAKLVDAGDLFKEFSFIRVDPLKMTEENFARSIAFDIELFS